MRVKRILCPTDLSTAAFTAVRHAAQLAEAHDAELFLYHAVATHSDEARGVGDLLKDYLARAEAQVRGRLETEAQRLRGNGVRVSCQVEPAVNAFTGVLAQTLAWRPDLMVLSTHAGETSDQGFLGSVSGKLVRHAPCSVMTVRPTTALPRATDPLRLLVPVDFSEGARGALAVARSLLREQDALLVLHVVHNPSHGGPYEGEPVHAFHLDTELPARLSRQIADWLEDQDCEIEVHEGAVGPTVLEVAEQRGVDVIVMGTRGLTGVDYLMMGSVAEKVVCGSRVPVVVAK